MDNDNKFCFRLNGFSRNIQHSWRRAQHEGDFYDVILACEDKQIQAHKLILSSSSPVLRSILKSYSNSQATIYLMGIKYKDLSNLVNFMYQGEVSIEQDELQRFISAAEDLQLEGIFGKDKESTNSGSYENSIPRLNFETEEMNEFNKNMSFKNTTEEVKYPTFSEINAMSQKNMQRILPVSQDNMKNIVAIHEDTVQNKTAASHDDVQDPDNVQNIQKKASVSQDIVQNIPSVGQDSIENNVPVTEHQENIVLVNQQKLYSCTKCDKLFKRKTNLYDHKLSAHEGVRYSCDLCSHKSKRIDSLRTHKAKVHEGVRTSYPCEQCDHIATRKDALYKHSVFTHGEGVCYQCDKCDFKAATEERLSVHTAKHLKQEKSYHTCRYCDRKFNGKALLNNHIARIHEKVTYACDNCDRKFNVKVALYTHMYATHSNNI